MPAVTPRGWNLSGDKKIQILLALLIRLLHIVVRKEKRQNVGVIGYMTERKCQAVKEDASPCQAWAIKGSNFCFLHTDPEKAAKAQKSGGYAKARRQKAKRELRLRPVKLVNLEDARKLLAETINAFRAGEISDSDSKCIGYLASQFVSAAKESIIEQRLDELEKLIENRLQDKDQSHDRTGLFDWNRFGGAK